MSQATFHVYILANPNRHLYVGVTNDLARRLAQHRARDPDTFTGRYGMVHLMRAEPYATAVEAIAREKQIKGWSRAKKVALIEQDNPDWNDLSGDAEFGRMLR